MGFGGDSLLKKRAATKKQQLAPGPTADATGTTATGRKKPADAEVIGQAQPRDAGTPMPEDPTLAASNAAGAALSAAQRARKKGSASSLLGGGMPLSKQAPAMNTGKPRTLLGF